MWTELNQRKRPGDTFNDVIQRLVSKDKMTASKKLYQQEEELKRLYWDEEKTLAEIAERYDCSAPTVGNAMDELGIERRGKGARNGEKNPRWNGGYPDASANWDEIRDVVLKRDEHQCQECGMGNERHNEIFGRSLHVHHITPRVEFEDQSEADEPANLKTVCQNCHTEIE